MGAPAKNNLGEVGGSKCVDTTISAEMQAFDRLPAIVRDALRDHPLPVSSEWALRQMERGVDPGAIAAHIRRRAREVLEARRWPKS